MLPTPEQIEHGAKPRSRVSAWPSPKAAFILIAANMAFWAAMAGFVLYTA